jgi:hypothetical protein
MPDNRSSSRVSVLSLGRGRFAVVLDGEPFGPVVPEDLANAVVWWLRNGGLEYLESPPKGEGPAIRLGTHVVTAGQLRHVLRRAWTV